MLRNSSGRACPLATLALLALCLSLPVAAQDIIALAVEGWRQESGTDGVVYYRCASEICAAGSVVSYKVQPHHPVTLAEFELHHRALGERNKGAGRIRDVRVAASIRPVQHKRTRASLCAW